VGSKTQPGVSAVRETLEGYLTADPVAHGDCGARRGSAASQRPCPAGEAALEPESRL